MKADLKKGEEAVSDDVAMVAFYGVESTPSAVMGFLHSAIHWFQSMGYPPDKISINGIGRSGKLYSFSRIEKKLKQIDYTAAKRFEMYSTLPSAKVWWLHSYLSAEYEGQERGTFFSLGVRCSLLPLSDLVTSEMTSNSIRLLKPSYGIGFSLPAQNGPGPFVFGITCGPPGTVLSGEEYEEAVRIGHWGGTGMPRQVYREGLLRDVFPWNFLTEPQLGKPVDRVPLEQWIKQDARRGSLRLLCDKVFLWAVAESNLLEVRHELHQAGVIFDWRKHS